MKFSDKFSTLIKHYRLNKKFTQQELAEMIDVGLRTYQRLETGEADPTIEVLLKLSEVLGFKFSEIFHYEENKSQEYLILESSAELLRKATRMARVGAWQYNFTTKEMYLSETTKHLFEVDANYFPDFESLINFYQEGADRDEIQKAIEQCKSTGNAFSKELYLISKNRTRLLVVTQGEAEYVDGVCHRIFGTIQDVTELRKKENTLARALNQLNEVQSLAGFGRWELKIPENQLVWSDSLFEIFEMDSNKFTASYDAFLELVHPEDRDAVNFAYTESLRTRQPYEIQHRLLMPDGRVKWIQEKCRTEFAETGAPLVSTGYALDITKYKNC